MYFSGKIGKLLTFVIVLGLSQSVFSKPLSFHDFYADSAVSVNAQGDSATLREDAFLPTVQLANDPFFGDPAIIVPAAGSMLTLNFDFVEGAGGNDQFGAVLFDSDNQNVLDSFFADESASGLISFDLSAFVGRNLGLRLELSSFDFMFDSWVSVFDPRLETAAAVPAPNGIFYLIATLLYFTLFRGRQRPTNRITRMQ